MTPIQAAAAAFAPEARRTRRTIDEELFRHRAWVAEQGYPRSHNSEVPCEDRMGTYARPSAISKPREASSA